MERFAFKIDKVLRANLYKICRLCGIDNPEKIPIISEIETDIFDLDAEPEISQKIFECVGFLINKDDKMPQMICALCVDKINDFYEFREMCFATNAQTRKLLGLKDPPKKNAEIKVELKNESSSQSKIEKRGKKRKSEYISTEFEIKIENDKPKMAANANLSKKRVRLGAVNQKNQTMDKSSKHKNLALEIDYIKTEVKTEPFVNAASTALRFDVKLKQICSICFERFKSKYKLERHKLTTHIPNIPRFVCTTCDETIKKNGDIRNHQLWHKLTKTPYTCGLCLETTSSINLYTRHMRDHSQKLATPLIVLDRICAQCNIMFCTNFLYNTHPCAVRTRKCGGCDQEVKNEIEYQRHATTCEKAYLIVSQYLLATLEPVRIKNENDVEAAAASMGLGSDTTSISLPIDVNNGKNLELNKSIKKGSKKGISKKALKRVDDLLKSTMDALVSIKHEPEMHVDSDMLNTAENIHSNMHGDDDAPASYDDDDFQNRDDSSDEGSPFVPIVELHTGNAVLIKQEPKYNTDKEINNTINVIGIKKEPHDSGYDDSSAAGSIGKIPVLKLKITKEHGTLNSSLVNDSPSGREKKKKKKKRKDANKDNEQTTTNEGSQNNPSNTPELSPEGGEIFAPMPQPGLIHIKQEKTDTDYLDYSGRDKIPREATVMTSIPIMQFQIACVSSGVEFNETDGEKEELQDVKPNRAELDRWLESNRTMASETNTELEADAQAGNDIPETEESSSSNISKTGHHQNKTACRSKAVKSTGGISRQDVSEIPKIVAVSSGFDAIAAHNNNQESSNNLTIPSITIKPEPSYDGYEDTQNNPSLPDVLHNDEEAYINSIDFSNINIKQENDIDVSEPQLTSQLPTSSYVGDENVPMETHSSKINKSDSHTGKRESSSKTAEDTEDELDDEDEEMELDKQEENAEREYREIEWPLNEKRNESREKSPINLGLLITSVCSHAEGSVNGNQNDETSKTITTEILSMMDSPSLDEPQKMNEQKKTHSEMRVLNASSSSSVLHNKNSILKKPKGKIGSDEQSEIASKALSPTDSCDMLGYAAVTMSLKVVENADSLLKASPCSKGIHNESDIRLNSSMENIDEEAQNNLNHQVLINSETQSNYERMSVDTQINSENVDVEFSSNPTNQQEPLLEKPTNSARLPACKEETDNFLNENVHAADSRRVRLRIQENEQDRTGTNSLNLSQRALMLDDSNINEIAENNNNANIERELLDDTERIAPSITVNQDDNNDGVT